MSNKPTCKTCIHFHPTSNFCGGIEQQFEVGLFLSVKLVTHPDKTCKVHTPKEAHETE